MHAGARPTICGRCGHLDAEHRRPGWLWALLGRWACRHSYTVGSLRQPSTVWCACDGWKAT